MSKALHLAKGARRSKRVIGRGLGSGRGRTAGRGHKGLKARGKVNKGFEGGQMPLIQRLPKVGFSNAVHKKVFKEIGIDKVIKAYGSEGTVSLETLREKNLIGNQEKNVKIIGMKKGDKRLEEGKRLRWKVEGNVLLTRSLKKQLEG